MQEEHPRLSYNRLSGQVEPIPELSETPVKTELAEQTDEPEKRVSIPRVSFNRKSSQVEPIPE